jgi:hypothetical protein
MYSLGAKQSQVGLAPIASSHHFDLSSGMPFSLLRGFKVAL